MVRPQCDENPKVVLANGCFDLLHPGHIAHLKEAKSFGDFLVVALTLDEYVGKPGRPIFRIEERAEMVRSLKCVSAVCYVRNAVEAIYAMCPAVFVKGSDYAEKGLLPAEIEACKAVGAEVRFTKSEKRSTTEVIERIRCGSALQAV